MYPWSPQCPEESLQQKDKEPNTLAKELKENGGVTERKRKLQKRYR